MSLVGIAARGAVVTASSFGISQFICALDRSRPPVSLKLQAIACIISCIGYEALLTIPSGDNPQQAEVYSLVFACVIFPTFCAIADTLLNPDDPNDLREDPISGQMKPVQLKDKAEFLILSQIVGFLCLKILQNVFMK